MLVALELRDFAIIDALHLELSPGLNVLSGETGAGKSILVDALTLLIGGRADAKAVRAGAQSALVQGFFSPHPTADPTEDLSTIARRVQASGRSTARLDGELVTVGELAQLGAQRVAIHGQHASQTLLESAEQRRLLDNLLSAEAQAQGARYRDLYGRLTEVERALSALEAAVRERARRLDILGFQVDEIDRAGLRPDEEEGLRAEVESLRFAERILQGGGGALGALSEGEPNALGLLGAALRDLETAGRYHPTPAALAHELREAVSSVQAIAAEVAGFLDDFEGGADRLEALEARLQLLDTLKLKYGDTLASVLAYRDEAARELGALQNAEASALELQTERSALQGELEGLAADLTAARRAAAAELSDAVTRELRPLGMANAEFSVLLEPLATLSPHGRDKVTFLLSANLGEGAGPLSAVASGGELSRVMLALNVVTGSDLPTLIFDEVDAGLGGQTARTVGALLKRLAAQHQVLVVTHLPQVAAFADAHFRVEKREIKGRTVTRVERLSDREREAELARMLSGATTKTALAHARELLTEVSAEVATEAPADASVVGKLEARSP